jgi:hypothetical protein
MGSELARGTGAEVLERVIVQGDLAQLTPAERVTYYRRVCESLGLNPLTRPFDYIVLNGRLTLYARKDAADQLRRIHGISVRIVAREMIDTLGLYVVTARATTPDGREDESIGAVPVKGLTGEALANAIMKAETKAKRRVTLSIVGLGWTDESEVESIPEASAVQVDHETGEILNQPSPATPATPATPEPAAVAHDRGGAKSSTNKQYRLLGALLDRVGLSREEAPLYISALIRREIHSAREMTREEVSLAIDHLQLLAEMLDELGVSEEVRRELMHDAALHGDVFDSRETLVEVLRGYEGNTE